MLRIGIDPWVGCGGEHVLPEVLRQFLENRGFFYLADVADPEACTLWNQGWLSGQRLRLPIDLQMIWGRYLRQLSCTFIRLGHREDELIWDHHPSGHYSPKLGYIQLSVAAHTRELVWWWKQLWKLKCPGKAKLLFWAILENKAPTWDILQKRSFQGPGICALCRQEEETILHLFLQCRYTQAVWVEVCNLLGFTIGWQGETVIEAFHHWWSEQNIISFRATPCILAWGIWISRNKSVFQERRVSIDVVAAQIASTVLHFRAPVKSSGCSTQI